METAIQKAAYSKFGSENEIEAQIDRKSGSIKIQKVLVIVEKVEEEKVEETPEEKITHKYQRKFSLEHRIKECKKIREKYPDRIPVIIEKSVNICGLMPPLT